MERFRTLLKTAGFSFALLTTAACSQLIAPPSKSKVALRFPEARRLNSEKLSASATYDWSRVCFIVNVTAQDIPRATTGQCEVPLGIFVGTVPPGGEVAIEIPRGNGRKLEVFSYLRASAATACPALRGGFGAIDRSKIVRVGQIGSFDTQTAEMSLTLMLQAPADGASVLSQYSMPATCATASAARPGSGRIAAGRQHQEGGHFVVEGTVGPQKHEYELNGGTFKVRMSRRVD